tara:strand:+ start:252 stop:650 length:399 start_codon:yes stop_codon:yes gene_type:complete
MQLFLKLAAGSVVLGFLFLGLGAYFNPTMILENNAFAWSPDGLAGISGARSVIGGHFLGLAIVGIYAFIKSQYKLFYILAISEFLIALGRIISFGFDGFEPRVLEALAIEIYFASATFFPARFLKSSSIRFS